MGKLLRFTVRAVSLFTLTISAVSLWGSLHDGGSQPPFVDSGDAPALLGVRPGITSYDDALQLMQSQHWTHLALPKRADAVFSQGSTRVLLSSNRDNRVALIVLIPAQNSAWGSFGQIVALLGPPQRLIVQRQFTESFWHGGQLEFIHGHQVVDSISPDDPLESMAVDADSSSIPTNAVAWRGFGSAEVYLGAAALQSGPGLKPQG